MASAVWTSTSRLGLPTAFPLRVARLREDERAVAADLARVHGVTLASAEYFVETLSGAERSVA